jgi:hypothetical protein
MKCSKLIEEYRIDDVRATLSELETSTPPDEFQEILQAFADVFAEPEGLPPHRATDHSIPLLPGSKPPNIRNSRLSYQSALLANNR